MRTPPGLAHLRDVAATPGGRKFGHDRARGPAGAGRRACSGALTDRLHHCRQGIQGVEFKHRQAIREPRSTRGPGSCPEKVAPHEP
jgi:hypothetical protein